MVEPARSIFDQINNYRDLEKLKAEGLSEYLYLECKAPGSPTLYHGLLNHFAQAISGFSNTEGGVIIWGAETTTIRQKDVITDLCPIANISDFSSDLTNKAPTLVAPRTAAIENKVIRERRTRSRGIVLTFIAKSLGDPVQSLIDQHYYYRSEDEFQKCPHEMIKRLFAATETPSIESVIESESIKFIDGSWKVPVTLKNESSAAGEHVGLSLQVLNPESCAEIIVSDPIGGFRDVSDINRGKKVYSASLSDVLHRGWPVVIGHINFKMKERKVLLRLGISIFANNMRAKRIIHRLNLRSGGAIARIESEDFLY